MPKIVGTATESGANVFAIDYSGRPAYLAQSPQFYKQTLVGVFERVYEVGPVFRAEPHDTVRHLAQYTSLDVELSFISDHRDVKRAFYTHPGPDRPSYSRGFDLLFRGVFRRGIPPHGGFAIGLERFMMRLLSVGTCGR